MRGASALAVGVACLSAELGTSWVVRAPWGATGFKAASSRRHQHQPQRLQAPHEHRQQWSIPPGTPALTNGHSNGGSRRKRSACMVHAATGVDPRSTPTVGAQGKDSAKGKRAKAAAAAAAALLASRAKGGGDPGVAGSGADAGAKPSGPWAARLTLAIVACLYGTNYAAIKFMGDYLDTSSLLTLRFSLASLALLPALKGVGNDVLMAGAEVGAYATLGYWAQAWSLRSLPASQIALVSCLAVLVVPFLDHLSGKRRAGVTTICAAILACGGAALLQSGGVDAAVADEAGILPHLLALMCPFFFGLSTWRMEDHVARHPGQALPLTAAQVAVVGASSISCGFLGGGFPSAVPGAFADPGMGALALGVLGWLGLVNTALVLYLETNALESVSASEATVIYSLEPLVGAGVASSMLGEPFGSSTALGASLVLGGCVCSSLGKGDDE